MRDNDDQTETDEPSRSQLRREALAVFKLAEALVALSESELEHVPLSEELREEISKAKATHQPIARKRQTQFLAKQLRRREEELDPIRATLAHDRDTKHRETAALHHLEVWRERLIHEGDTALAELLTKFPQADRQRLRQLARHALEEQHTNRPPASARILFRALRELFEEN